MSKRCLKCFRPEKTCYCSSITTIDTGVKFLFLMHPHEAYQQKTGTGRLASLSLINSEIIIDKTFDENRRTQALINNPEYYPMLLYPGKEAETAEEINFTSRIGNQKLLVILIDATWVMARKMMFHSRSLQKLPRLTFSNEYRSRFFIKTQPEAYCLSTIESTYYLIKEFQKNGICDPDIEAEGLINVFDKMVRFQMNCREKRIGSRKVSADHPQSGEF